VWHEYKSMNMESFQAYVLDESNKASEKANIPLKKHKGERMSQRILKMVTNEEIA